MWITGGLIDEVHIRLGFGLTNDSDVSADAKGGNWTNDIERSAVDNTNVLEMGPRGAHVLDMTTGPARKCSPVRGRHLI